MNTFTILGAGWLGKTLAFSLKSDFKVKLSSRNEKKAKELEKDGFLAYILNENDLTYLDELLDTDYLFINYPPSKFEDYLLFLQKIYQHPKIANIKKIIFISSTSIYPEVEGTFREDFLFDNFGKKIVFDAEKLVLEKSHVIFRVSGLLGEDRIAGKRLSNKIVDFPKSVINFVHRKDVINATIFALNKDLNGIFNLCSKQHPSKEELYTFNSLKYDFQKPIFEDRKEFMNRIIDGSKIEKLGFEYKYFDAFNF